MQIMFALIFSVARMGVGPYLTYVTLRADNPFVIKVQVKNLALINEEKLNIIN